ncbi:MAG TPA: SET domain-containing protein-lysine N-methyltransferase, partial [Polyangiaceae bacterium]|nr:SET domain-containing protein-lysine N-methyltransferase [Polyangiaceae bacterium]
PKQRRVDVDDPEATAAAETKLTLLSERWWVIIPDTSVPGGWLCNHSCQPNAAIFSDREGRIQCTRPIAPGEEVTIFYGWVTQNEPERDPCLCGSPRCRGFINFDLSDEDARLAQGDSPESEAVRARLTEYVTFLHSIGQEQVEETIARTLATLRAKRS